MFSHFHTRSPTEKNSMNVRIFFCLQIWVIGNLTSNTMSKISDQHLSLRVKYLKVLADQIIELFLTMRMTVQCLNWVLLSPQSAQVIGKETIILMCLQCFLCHHLLISIWALFPMPPFEKLSIWGNKSISLVCSLEVSMFLLSLFIVLHWQIFIFQMGWSSINPQVGYEPWRAKMCLT